MCMFSRPVRHVAQTRIFARPLAGDAQALVYSMNVTLEERVAMVLPLPVPPGAADDAVRFVDLSGYPRFFADLDRAFPAMPRSRGGGRFAPASAPALPKLVVHAVGDFEASFVPAVRDFDRLDERFRIDARVWHQLPAYADFGFAVFELAPRRRLFGFRAQTIHPMAFVFPRRDPRSLFFPTVHVHDGAVHADATFDHQLYCQPDPVTAATFAWRRSSDRLGAFVDAGRAAALVDPDARVYRTELRGTHRNTDVTLVPPDVAPELLVRRGAHYELGLRASAAYDDAPEGRATPWQAFARAHLPALSAHLAAALDALAQRRADAWSLARYDERLPSYARSQLGERHVLVGPDTGLPFEPTYRPPAGPGRIELALRDDERVEPQHVVLAFTHLPDDALMTEIQRELDAALAGAVRACVQA